MQDQLGLFSHQSDEIKPLAYKLRPDNFDDFIGQESVINKLKQLRADYLYPMILWGPPGVGKTTLALLLSKHLKLKVYQFNAVLGGVNDLRKLIDIAKDQREKENLKSIIFIDEIHRFNKAQQDALLPYVERNDFIFIGATTENPKTSINKALLSRLKILKLEKLSEENIQNILTNAMTKLNIQIGDDLLKLITKNIDGDARQAISLLEEIINNIDNIKSLSINEIQERFLSKAREYDKNSDRHYDVISAFIKSIRGSDVNAALQWLAVMLDGGEDPQYIARRLMISASEDIGNADPRAIQMASSTHYIVSQIGMPEARIPLSQLVCYLAHAPKSNTSYMAINKALDYVQSQKTIEVPTHLRNHHLDKAKYKYPFNYPNNYINQDYTPTHMTFYQSSENGYEKIMNENLKKIKS